MTSMTTLGKYLTELCIERATIAAELWHELAPMPERWPGAYRQRLAVLAMDRASVWYSDAIDGRLALVRLDDEDLDKPPRFDDAAAIMPEVKR